MIEPEVAFNDIADNMDLAEEFSKYCVKGALDNCADYVKFLNDMFDKGLIERLQGVLTVSYTHLVPLTTSPRFQKEAAEIALQMSQFSVDELERLLRVNAKIAVDNYKRYQAFQMCIRDRSCTRKTVTCS